MSTMSTVSMLSTTSMDSVDEVDVVSDLPRGTQEIVPLVPDLLTQTRKN